MTATRSEARLVHVTPANTGVLQHIAPDVFDDDIDPTLLARFLATPGHILFVADLDGVVVGQCLGIVLCAVDRPPSLLIENLGVTPGQRRRGIARRMLRTVCAAGADQGCAVMWLGADPDSDTARPFYQAIGLPLRDAAFTEIDLPLP